MMSPKSEVTAWQQRYISGLTALLQYHDVCMLLLQGVEEPCLAGFSIACSAGAAPALGRLGAPFGRWCAAVGVPDVQARWLCQPQGRLPVTAVLAIIHKVETLGSCMHVQRVLFGSCLSLAPSVRQMRC